MASTENLDIFFNEQEFATLAWIQGYPVAGLIEHTWVNAEEVDLQRTTFTCPSSRVDTIRLGEVICLGEARLPYTVVRRHPDGTGLTVLLLEKR